MSGFLVLTIYQNHLVQLAVRQADDTADCQQQAIAVCHQDACEYYDLSCKLPDTYIIGSFEWVLNCVHRWIF